jgi:predicted nucleic acid-binding protein
MYLIDTSVWIFALRKNPVPEIRERVDMLLATERVAIHGMIRLELLGGTRTVSEYERLSERLDGVIGLGDRRELWDRAARLQFDLRRSGVTVPPTDALIASCAIDVDAILVHADAHFDLVARHTALRVESVLGLLGNPDSGLPR